MGMTNCISRVLQAVVNISLKKSRQIAESQPPTEIFVKELLNAGAAEFKAHLEVMFVHFPGEPVDELNIRIHAMPWVGGVRSGLGKKRTPARRSHGYKNDGQAGICRARSRAGWTGDWYTRR